MPYTCFTDGSAINNPWSWWWAWVVVKDWEILKHWSGWVSTSTNNIMELQAVIELLKSFVPMNKNILPLEWEWLFSPLPISCDSSPTLINERIVITTDSTYVQKWITEWIDVWIRRGRRRSKWWKLVANVELWKELYALVWYFENLDWIWTKAHVGTKRNERVDTEARKQAIYFDSKKSF